MKNYLSINSLIPSFNKVLNIPGDKSLSIRWVLLASQAIGKSKAYNLLESDDVTSTIISMRKLGVEIFKKKRGCYEINGVGLSGFNHKNNLNLNAGNSGTFARLLLGLLVKSSYPVKIIGDKSLSRRDFQRVTSPLKQFGARFVSKNETNLPLTISGSEHLRPINYFEKKRICTM